MLDRIAQHGARHAAGIADLRCGYHRGVAGESFPGQSPASQAAPSSSSATSTPAPRVGSGKVHVLATPVMINLIEAAALAAIEPRLPKGYQSLGTRLEVRHIAAARWHESDGYRRRNQGRVENRDISRRSPG